MFQCLWKHPLLHLTFSNLTNRTGSAYWPREGSNFIWTNWFEPCSFRTWYSVVRGTLRFGLNQQHGGCLRSRTGTALHLAYSLVCNKRCLRLVWHAWPVSRSATTSQQGATLLFRCFQPLHNFYLQFVPETEPNLIIVWSQINFQCLQSTLVWVQNIVSRPIPYVSINACASLYASNWPDCINEDVKVSNHFCFWQEWSWEHENGRKVTTPQDQKTLARRWPLVTPGCSFSKFRTSPVLSNQAISWAYVLAADVCKCNIAGANKVLDRYFKTFVCV